MIKSYELREDPRSAPIRVLSGLPISRYFIKPFQPNEDLMNDSKKDSTSENIITSASTLFVSDDNKFNNYPVVGEAEEKIPAKYENDTIPKQYENRIDVFISGCFGGMIAGIFGRSNTRILARPTFEVASFGSNICSQFGSINIDVTSSQSLSRPIPKSSKIISRALAAGMLFTTNAYFQSQFKANDSKHNQSTIKKYKFPISSVLAAAATGGVMATILTPIELIKTRYSMQQAGPFNVRSPFRGGSTTSLSPQIILHEIKLIMEQQGFAALYKGGSVIYTGKMMGNIAYFSVYEIMKSFLQSVSCDLQSDIFHVKEHKVSPSEILLSGSLAGMAYYTVMYPIKTIKATFQLQSINNPRLDTIFNAIGETGLMNTYRGWFSGALRAAPANAVLFLGYELARSMFSTARTN